MTVVEISECFPNKFKPVTGEFILQHVRALSKYCNVVTIVPLRFIPPKELLSFNPVKLISNIFKWFKLLRETENYSEGNLRVIYSGYISLPRPYFEFTDNIFIKNIFYNRIKNIISESNPDLIYCNWIKPWAELSGKLAKEFNIPFVIDHHEDIPTLKKLFPGKYKNFLNVFENTDNIIVHSTLNKNELQEENLNLAETDVIYLGQNLSVTEARKDFNFNKVNLICVSHLSEERKSIDVLIKALKILKNKMEFSLTIVGDGIFKKKYINLSREFELESEIKFTGAKNQKEISDLLSDSDFFVLPSYPEAFGIVFIEALAKGLPVITCKGNGGGEELKHLGYPVILVNPNSPEELAKAIIDLSNDENKMSLMSEKGKQIVKKYFTWDLNGKNTYDTLIKTLKKFREKNQCAE